VLEARLAAAIERAGQLEHELDLAAAELETQRADGAAAQATAAGLQASLAVATASRAELEAELATARAEAARSRAALASVNGWAEEPRSRLDVRAEKPRETGAQLAQLGEDLSVIAIHARESASSRAASDERAAEPVRVMATALAATPAAAANGRVPERVPAAGESAGPIKALVGSWAGAWSRQDVEAYLGFYGDAFQPRAGASRASWENERRERLRRPGGISVEVRDIEVSWRGADRVRATFVQDYRSDRYQDRVRKTLLLAREPEGWRIVRETSQPLGAPQSP
jgi:ketosteroid isomerase-like protein